MGDTVIDPNKAEPTPAVDPPPSIAASGLKNRAMVLYEGALDIIVGVLVFVMLLTLLGALGGIALDLASAASALRTGVTTHSLAHGVVDAIDRELVIDVLSVFVLIELFRTFTDYLEFHRVRLRVLAEVGIAFILREIFVGLYDHEMNWPEILALAALMAVLVAARICAQTLQPRRQPLE